MKDSKKGTKKTARVPQGIYAGFATSSVECDQYDEYTFSRLRAKLPRLEDLEVKGTEQLSTFPGLFQDCYSALYKLEPELRPTEKIRASHRPHRKLLEQVMNTEEYGQLRAYTTLQEFESALGVEVTATRALAYFTEEQKQQIREMQQQEQECSDLQQQANGLEAAATAAQQMAADAEAQADAAGETGNGQAQAEAEAQAQQAQSTADSLSQQAGNARMSLEQAKQKLGQMAADLDQKLDQNPDKNRRAARQIARQAKEAVEEASEYLEAWGDETGELRKGDPAQALAYANKISGSKKLRELAKLIGRMKRMALSKTRSKTEAKAEVVDVTIGNDLASLHPQELRRLAHPSLRTMFLKDWAEGSLLQFVKRDKETQGKGPIIVCEDGSGSMSGAKETWAKAVSLALAEIARTQQRGFAWVHFGSRHSPLSVEVAPGGRVTPELMFQIAETFLDAAGTDFESPMGKAQELIKKQEFRKADIVFVTDGECTVSDSFLERFRAARKAHEFQVHAVLINIDGSTSTAATGEFSDTSTLVSDLTVKQAGEVFEKI